MLGLKKQSKLFLYIKALVLAVISSLAVVVNNGTPIVDEEVRELVNSSLALSIWKVISAFDASSYFVLLVIIMTFVGYIHLIPKVNKNNIKYGIPFSLIASLFLLLCDSYNKVGSWDNLFESKSAIVTSGLKGLGTAVLIFFAFDLVNRISIEKVQFEESSDKKAFLKLTLIMFVCWIPYMILEAPGSMAADTRDQFAQILGNSEMSWTVRTFAYEQGDILLNNHHPVFHTLVLGAFLKFGELIGSYFAGIEIYCILQSFIFAGALTFSVIRLKALGMSKTLSRIVYLFFVLCPIFPLWGMTTFKDTPFAIALLVTVILLYDAFKKPEEFTGKKYFYLAAALLLLMLVRNNGFYMLLVLVPFVIIHFRKDKKFLLRMAAVMLIPMIIFKVGITGIIFNAVGIHDASPREMLSVPFQQTARYVLEYGDEITAEEEDAILSVLGREGKPLEDLGKIYVPDRSDTVKATYKITATNEDLIDYFKVWFKQFTKHPAVYVEAYLHLNYSWFCFDSEWDTIYYDGITDDTLPEWVDGLENPQCLTGERSIVFAAVTAVSQLPIINCVFEFSFYTWAYVIIFIAMLIRKKHRELLACLPIFANYAICFVGPVAYMRYVIPMLVCIPFVIFITFSRNRSSDEATKDISTHEIWLK